MNGTQAPGRWRNPPPAGSPAARLSGVALMAWAVSAAVLGLEVFRRYRGRMDPRRLFGGRG